MDSSFRFLMLRGFLIIFFCECSRREGKSMSEMIIEHPILIIESLLKMGLGDEGRLLYLRKALTNGKSIYESDKNYLKKMYHALHKNYYADCKFLNQSKSKIETTTKNSDFKNNSFDLSKKCHSDDGDMFDTFESEMQTLHNSIEDLKKKESQIKDNLELIMMNREILTQRDVDTSNSFGKFSNLSKISSSDLFELLATDPILEKSSFFRIPKYRLMTGISAGLFSLWFAGHQNFLDLGSFQGFLLGISAGSATLAGLFYQKEKRDV